MGRGEISLNKDKIVDNVWDIIETKLDSGDLHSLFELINKSNWDPLYKLKLIGKLIDCHGQAMFEAENESR